MLKITKNIASTAIAHKQNYKPELELRLLSLKQRVKAFQANPTKGNAKRVKKEFATSLFTGSIFDEIEEFIKQNGEMLLDSKPDELIAFSNDYNAKKQIYPAPDLLYRGIEYVFDYDAFLNSTSMWNAYALINQLKVSVCPYCNRSYIFIVDKSTNSRGVRPELDHFYCRKDHPILSVSFYNLIPSCHTCNHTKSDTSFSHTLNLHPYLEGLSITDLIFDFNVRGATTGSINAEDVVIQMLSTSDVRTKDKFDANKKSFVLENLYSLHKENAARIIKLSAWYDDNFRASLKTILNTNNDDDIDFMIIGTRLTQDDLLNHPLSKFSHDIFRQCRRKSNIQRHRIQLSS